MPEKTRSCPKCGAQLPFNASICTSCGSEQTDLSETPIQHPAPGPVNPSIGERRGEVNAGWYIVSLFTIVGGFLAWVANRKKDPRKARDFLILGALATILLVYLIFF